MSQHPEEFILRWAQTAAAKAVALADVLEAAGIDPCDELHAIGAVLGKGSRAFDAVIADVDAFDFAWCNDHSPQLIWLAHHALARRTRVGTEITTAFTARHREIFANQEAWSADYQRQRGIEEEPSDPEFRAARGVVELGGCLRERIALVPGCHISEPSVNETARDALTADGSDLIAGPEFAMQRAVGLAGGEAFAIKRRTSLDLAQYVQLYATGTTC